MRVPYTSEMQQEPPVEAPWQTRAREWLAHFEGTLTVEKLLFVFIESQQRSVSHSVCISPLLLEPLPPIEATLTTEQAAVALDSLRPCECGVYRGNRVVSAWGPRSSNMASARSGTVRGTSNSSRPDAIRSK